MWHLLRLNKPFRRVYYPARAKLTAILSGPMGGPELGEGTEAYVDYVENQITKCVAESSFVLSEIFGPGEPELRVTQLFDAVADIAIFLRTLDSQSTLEDITQRLRHTTRQYRASDPILSRPGTGLYPEHHIAFAFLGWLSMLWIPFPEFSGQTLRILDTAPTLLSVSSSLSTLVLPPQLSGAIRRPLASMLRQMDMLPIACPVASRLPNESPNPYTPAATSLQVSIICYWSLYRIGGLSVVWVDNLMDHCQFDLARKEIKVFRYPTWCLQAFSGNHNLGVLGSILKAHTCQRNCGQDLPEAVERYLGEVLLSYRLLFGQDKKSRKLFRSQETTRVCSDGSTIDPILLLLCGRKRALPIMNHINMDREVFDLALDFIHFGERLLILQEYNAKQKPSAWRSILADRRDPRESFNFLWTVVVVGGISITLSLIQTAVGIAQLVISLHDR